MDRLRVDLDYVSRNAKRTFLMFHDPNFAVVFDRVFDALETLPEERRPPYIFESSLTVLRDDRIKRLSRTNCVMVAPGIESWTDYSNKAAVGRASGPKKVELVADHFARLNAHVRYLQGNFMFGLDTDSGRDPVELTKSFMDRTPFVWPAFNIPMPFGGTPLQSELLAKGRVLTSMPFGFYYAPYSVTTWRNYDPVDYYTSFIELMTHATSGPMLAARLANTRSRAVRFIHRTRTAGVRSSVRRYQEILDLLRTDSTFHDFHTGRRSELPEFYRHRQRAMLGSYAQLPRSPTGHRCWTRDERGRWPWVHRQVGVGAALKWVVIVAWLALGGGFGSLAGGLGEAQANDAAAWLPTESESARAMDRSALFFDPDNIDANVVIERTDGPLTAVDRQAVETLTAALQGEDHIVGTPTVEESMSGPALLVHVTMNPGKGGWATLREVAAGIRTLGGGLPEGLSLYVAGPAGAAADQSEAFSGVDGSCSSPRWGWSSSCCS